LLDGMHMLLTSHDASRFRWRIGERLDLQQTPLTPILAQEGSGDGALMHLVRPIR
jgi:hypothetical protein